MTWMLERQARPNSASTSDSSGATRPKMRRAIRCVSSTAAVWPDVCIGCWACSASFKMLVGAVVRVLHVDAEIFGLEPGDDVLQGVAVAARDPHHVALNRG